MTSASRDVGNRAGRRPSDGTGSSQTAGVGTGTGQTDDAGGIGPRISSWLLRAVLALACMITVGSTVLWCDPAVLLEVSLVAAAVATVVWPNSHAATALIAIAAMTVFGTDPGLAGWIMPAVLGVHAVHSLAALAAVVPWDTDVELAALRPSARRFVVVQVATQALVVLALLVSP